MYTLNCKGKILAIDRPLVMGIINVTPDSFYESEGNVAVDSIVDKAAKMIAEGAGILDIGGQSTRPGSERLNATAELDRVLPVIAAIHKQLPKSIISVDTYHAAVAREAILAGASMVNDVSGGNLDREMLQTVSAMQVPYVCMHMQGEPGTMQQNPQYENVALNILDFFIGRVAECQRLGIHDIIIDPGFGFGKTIEHNFSLLKALPAFKILQCPLLVGLSRKSTIYKTLGVSAAESLNGTTVLHTLALQNGANILRVHDVKPALEAIVLHEAYKKAAD